jgi:hypothetical protein
MCFAILPLIQVATLPRLVVRSPERLTLPLPRSLLIRHLVLSIFKSKARTDRVRLKLYKGARNGRLPRSWTNSLFEPHNSLQARAKFPVPIHREFYSNPLILE